MRAIVLAAALSAAGLAACTAAPTAPTPAAAVPPVYPIQDFFRSAPKAYFRVSKDGRSIGFMQPTGEARRYNIVVQTLDGSTPVGEPRVVTDERARSIEDYFWKGGGTLLYSKDFGGDENFHVVAVDALSAKITDLTPYPGVRAAIADDLPDDPDHVLVRHNRRDPKVFDVFKVDIRTGEAQLVAENPGNVVGWQTDHQGRVRIAVTSDGVNTSLLYRDGESGPLRALFTTDYRTEVKPQFFLADDRRFYALSNRGRDRLALVVIDPAQPDSEELVYEHPEVDLGAAAWSRARKRLTHVEYVTERTGRRFFDPAMERVFERIQAKLPGYEVLLQSATRAEDKFIVAAFSDRTPGTRYVYDANADTLSKLADINPWLPERDMAPMRPVTIRSRDGLPLHGYLTLPVGRPAHDLACVVHPHGGPWLRDAWGYDAEVQLLANRGLCVLQVNFRGSSGYGRSFWEASFGQWGLKMQDDVTDAVQWLVREGLADPRRVGIYGASYGGYTTLAGVTFTPDLYAAAVDYVGVSNLFTFLNTIPPYWKPMLEQMHAMVGDPVKDRARLEATSPALHVDRIRTPLFIAQGARDPRVNKAESDQVVDALRRRGVEVQYMVKDNEGYGFQNEENQFDFYAAMAAFLVQHLKPQ
jgi:dipeptidyl aminopeptidase/acylaminoacyl peptidase